MLQCLLTFTSEFCYFRRLGCRVYLQMRFAAVGNIKKGSSSGCIFQTWPWLTLRYVSNAALALLHFQSQLTLLTAHTTCYGVQKPTSHKLLYYDSKTLQCPLTFTSDFCYFRRLSTPRMLVDNIAPSTVNYTLSDRIEKGKTVQLNMNFDPQTTLVSRWVSIFWTKLVIAGIFFRKRWFCVG